jgi:ABC-2 type transport system permease protein
MKQLLTFIRKEFYHVLRDRRTFDAFRFANCASILFGFALSTEIKNTNCRF